MFRSKYGCGLIIKRTPPLFVSFVAKKKSLSDDQTGGAILQPKPRAFSRDCGTQSEADPPEPEADMPRESDTADTTGELYVRPLTPTVVCATQVDFSF